jgi:flavodoxin
MIIVIVYWTRYGNNKRIVDYLAGKLKGKADVQVFSTDETDPAALPVADRYVFSSAAEAFRVQKNMRKFMKKLKDMDGRKYGIINTHGMQNRNWLKSMTKILNKKKMVKVAEADFAMGREVENAAGLQDGWEKKLDAFAGKMVQ